MSGSNTLRGGIQTVELATEASRARLPSIVSKHQALVQAGITAAEHGHLDVGHANATKVLRDGPDGAVKARALHLLGFCASYREKPIQAVRVLERAVQEAQAAGDSWCLAQAFCAVGRAHMYAGNHRTARTCFAGALEIAVDAGDRTTRPCALLGLGWVHLVEGSLDQAKTMFLEARAVAGDIEDPLNQSEALAYLGELAKVSGDGAGALESFDEALVLAEDSGSQFHKARALAGQARVAQEENRPQDAAALFGRVIAIAGQGGFWYVLGRALLGRSRALVELADREVARRLIEEALELARGKEDNEGVGACLFALGRLARIEENEQEAIRLHHEALAVRDQIGHREGLAESLEAIAGQLVKTRADTAARLVGAAKALRASNGEKSSREGCPCCRQDRIAVQEALPSGSFKHAVSQGITLSPAEAVAYASRGRGPRDKTRSSGWDSLSPTELRVARLAAEGLTNPEIGEKLFISRRTAGSHLTHIYKKLGIASRRELREAVKARRVPA